jgi:alkanesulfonate monooxygenase SsuD/methylene tetrahydromethanopterin reductase-like flavin-dependent oxidoreductase (luciferase family)
LRVAGRVADGVILQLADPELIRWFLGFVREGAAEAGRRFEDIEVQAAAPAYVSDDLAHAREQVRWFPALVSNHVVDLLRRYPMDQLPAGLVSYVDSREGYDYHEHGRVGAGNERFVSDAVVDRFCMVGPAAACRARLSDLRAAGVTQFNSYNMGDDVDGQMRIFADQLIGVGEEGEG